MKKIKTLKKENKKDNEKLNLLMKKFLFFIYKNLYNLSFYYDIEKQYYKRNNKLNDKYYNYYQIF